MPQHSRLINELKPLACLALVTSLSAWEPAPDSMITEWGEKLTPDTAWQEYPRPALARKEWTNLNGLWNHGVSNKSTQQAPEKWDGQILVPFCIESALSGVKKRITSEDAIWYRRTFSVTVEKGKRVILNFEAVDYQSTLWVNGKKTGTHTGGNLPFSFDMTDALIPGINTLTLKVTDATNDTYQLHGKQINNPHGIWYTPVSGIWQTVWLEQVPETYIERLKITPAIDGTVKINVISKGRQTNKPAVKVVVSLDGKHVAEAEGTDGSMRIKIPEPKLWSPDSPTLYDLTVTYGNGTVTSYVGLRESTVAKDENGHLRLLLNGKPLFHWGTLVKVGGLTDFSPHLLIRPWFRTSGS